MVFGPLAPLVGPNARSGLAPSPSGNNPGVVGGVLHEACITLLSALALERSADTFLDALSSISSLLGVEQTFVALLTAGAEWEELTVVISALGLSQPSLALSNIIGSSIANLLGGFSLPLLFLPYTSALASHLSTSHKAGVFYFSPSAKLYAYLQLGVTLVVCPLIWIIQRPELFTALASDKRAAHNAMFGAAFFLSVAFVAYIGSALVLIAKGRLDAPEGSDSGSSSSSSSENGGSSDGESEVGRARAALGLPSPVRSEFTERSALLPSSIRRIAKRRRHQHRHFLRFRLIKPLSKLLWGFLILSVASYLLSSSLIAISSLLVFSQTTLGLTLASFITTLPEKFLGAVAGKRGNGDVVVASVAGSNIFLLTLCLAVVLFWQSGHGRGNVLDPHDKDGGVTTAAAAMARLVVPDGNGSQPPATPHKPNHAQVIRTEELAVLVAASLVVAVIVRFGARRWHAGVLLLAYLGFLAAEVSVWRRSA